MYQSSFLQIGWISKLLAVTASLAACSVLASGEASSDQRLISIADVRVEMGIGSPIPVEVLVSGTWPDLCAQLAQVTQQIEGSLVRIMLTATAADPNCPPDHLGLPFRIAVPLNMVELPEGEYLISVNGSVTQFEWLGGHPTTA